MRLIDADALVAQEEFFAKIFKGDFGEQVATHVIEVINDAPTVDAVPVIRCKDCKHYYKKEWVVGGGSYTTCWYQTIANAQPNDYCSRAERKDNG